MVSKQDLASPATGSTFGTLASGYVLNSIRSQLVLINQLMGNVIIFSLFSIGGVFLASAIGLYIQQGKERRKYTIGVSFASTQITQSILPLFVGIFMLNNTQQGMETIVNNYLFFMAVCGIAMLLGSWLLFKYVK